MPRILKADLVAENERLRAELAKYQSEGQADLCAENERLHKELSKYQLAGSRVRSRSPRRPSESAATTRRALELVCHLERDEVIQEQREIIARQQQDIQSLMDGEGPVGSVLLAIFKKNYPTCVSEYRIQKLSEATTPVRDVIHRLERLASHTSDLLNWGESHWDRYQRM